MLWNRKPFALATSSSLLLTVAALVLIYLFWRQIAALVILALILVALGAVVGYYGQIFSQMRQRGYHPTHALAIPLCMTFLGLNLGLAFWSLSPNHHLWVWGQYGWAGAVITGLSLTGLTIQPVIQYQRRLANYKRHEQFLIQP